MHQRAERLSSSIHKIAAETLHGIASGAYLTVTRVDVSPDLRQALIWVSVYSKKEKEKEKEKEVFSVVLEQQLSVKNAIAKQLHLRKVPNIEFRHDTTASLADDLNKLM